MPLPRRMQRAPLLLLTDPHKPLQVLDRAWPGQLLRRRACIVLGSHFYTHFQLNAAGIPTSKLASFVRLELGRLTPYADAQACFMKQGTTLQVFAWSKSRVNAALSATLPKSAWPGLDVSHCNFRPESALGDLPSQGWHLRAMSLGVEALQTDDNALKKWQWWPAMPATAELAQFFEAGLEGTFEAPRVNGLSGQQRLEALAWWRPSFWSGTWRDAFEPNTATKPDAPSPATLANNLVKREQRWAGIATLCLVATAGFAYWSVQQRNDLAAQTQLLQSAIDKDLAQGRKQVDSALAVKTDPRLAQAKLISTSIDSAQVLKELRTYLPGLGLVIRQFGLERETLTLTLVSAWGEAIDLEEATAAFEKMPGVRSLEITDVTDPKVVKFQFKLTEHLLESWVKP